MFLVFQTTPTCQKVSFIPDILILKSVFRSFMWFPNFPKQSEDVPASGGGAVGGDHCFGGWQTPKINLRGSPSLAESYYAYSRVCANFLSSRWAELRVLLTNSHLYLRKINLFTHKKMPRPSKRRKKLAKIASLVLESNKRRKSMRQIGDDF